MALIDDIKKEIKMAHLPKPEEQPKEKPEKKRRHKTKEEIAAYIARKQAEEEERMLAKQGAEARPAREKPRRGRKPKVQDDKAPEIKDRPKNAELKPRQKKSEGYCSKCRPKTIKTVDLPDGGSIVIIYMPGAPS